jgi:hypothetical protein
MKALLCGAVCALALGGTAGAATIIKTVTVPDGELAITYYQGAPRTFKADVAITPVRLAPFQEADIEVDLATPLLIPFGDDLWNPLDFGHPWPLFSYPPSGQWFLRGFSWGALAGSAPLTVSDVPIDTSAVPEPATWALMLGGLGLVGWALRRRQYRLLTEDWQVSV